MAVLQLLIRLPRPMDQVWPSLSTPEGLATWFTPADVLQPRLGGTVTLGDLGTGTITAWDVDRMAEYTVDPGGRIRFHLEPDGETGSALRFTHESKGEAETEQHWRDRFERLIDSLAS
ncbi:SRPBCC domain-containing protein [Streptomyces sp. NPDC059467]|uniref:SRPBCC domain-containing protein n=1 Tax=Streptomyces sp. NPDC059467 TaxID=3346844 RepID=UPI003697E578